MRFRTSFRKTTASTRKGPLFSMTHSARCDIAASVASARVGRYGEGFWTPIRYVNRFHSRTALARIYRSADVALVRPPRDGMSLVAKEYVAAKDAVNPGVLILSQFAGAAAELTGALIAKSARARRGGGGAEARVGNAIVTSDVNATPRRWNISWSITSNSGRKVILLGSPRRGRPHG